MKIKFNKHKHIFIQKVDPYDRLRWHKCKICKISQDCNCNETDFILTINGGDIAVRLRRSKYNFRDLTIRAKRETGSETELSKIKRGLGRWFLYGWLNNDNQIYNWIFVDMNSLRSSGLLDISEEKYISNNDGTYFLAIPVEKLKEKNCLVDYVI